MRFVRWNVRQVRIDPRKLAAACWACCAALGLTLVGASGSPLRAADDADVIFHHGKVVTVDPKFSIVEAMAIKGDRIVAVGKNDEILKLAGEKTRRVDLKGRTMIPGLADSHVHPTGAAMHDFDHVRPPMDSIADVLAYIDSRTKVLPEGEWITMSQVFITRLRDRRYPTRKELDQVAPKHPVMFSTGPDASVNSLALKLSGVDKNFQLPKDSVGKIERDPATGEPTGILRSCSNIIKSKAKSKQATRDDQLQRLKLLFADYNAVGITSISDKNSSDGNVGLYADLLKSNQLTCRVTAHLGVGAGGTLDAIEQRLTAINKHPNRTPHPMLWINGIKIFLDGGMLTGSAYMRKPWGVSKIYSIEDPEYRGLLYVQPDKLAKIVRKAVDHDLQMTAHSVGDGAVHHLIDAYVAVNRELVKEAAAGAKEASGTSRYPISKKRPLITHCNFMSLDAVLKMKEYGIIADLQPAWLFLDGETLRKQFGDERLAYFQPYRSMFEHGVMVGGGSDHMQKIDSLRAVNPYNPFLGMWITLTRFPRNADKPLHAEQRLDRQQALRLYTINNAYLCFREKELGSLEAGKLADFVILPKDILKCPLPEVRTMQVDETWVGGKAVYIRDSVTTQSSKP